MAGIGKPRGRGVRKFMPQLREGMPLRRMKLNAREKLAKIRVDHPKLTGAVDELFAAGVQIKEEISGKGPEEQFRITEREFNPGGILHKAMVRYNSKVISMGPEFSVLKITREVVEELL